MKVNILPSLLIIGTTLSCGKSSQRAQETNLPNPLQKQFFLDERLYEKKLTIENLCEDGESLPENPGFPSCRELIYFGKNGQASLTKNSLSNAGSYQIQGSKVSFRSNTNIQVSSIDFDLRDEQELIDSENESWLRKESSTQTDGILTDNESNLNQKIINKKFCTSRSYSGNEMFGNLAGGKLSYCLNFHENHYTNEVNKLYGHKALNKLFEVRKESGLYKIYSKNDPSGEFIHVYHLNSSGTKITSLSGRVYSLKK